MSVKCASATANFNSTWVRPEESAQILIVQQVLTAGVTLWMPIWTLVWLLHEKRIKYLRVRSFPLIVCSTLGMVFFAFTGPFPGALGANKLSCDAMLILTYLAVPMIGASTIVQVFNFYVKSKLAQAAQKVDVDKLGEDALAVKYSISTLIRDKSFRSFGSKHSLRTNSSKDSFRKGGGGGGSKVDKIEEEDDAPEEDVKVTDGTDLEFLAHKASMRSMNGADAASSTHSMSRMDVAAVNSSTSRMVDVPTAGVTTIQPDPNGTIGMEKSSVVAPGTPGSPSKRRARDLDEMLRPIVFLNSRLSSRDFTIAVLFLFITPFLIAALVRLSISGYGFQGCYGCTLEVLDAEILLFAGIALDIVCALVLWQIRKYPDPFGVVRQGFHVLISSLVVGAGAIYYITQAPTRGSVAAFQAMWIVLIGIFCIFQAQVIYPFYCAIRSLESRSTEMGSEVSMHNASMFTISAALGKKGSRPVNSRRASKREMPTPEGFLKILQTPNLLDAFEKHITAEFGVESLRFWLEVGRWRQSFHDWTVKTQRLQAKRMVRVFIGNDAVFPINVDYGTQQKIRFVVDDDVSQIRIDLFDHARELIFDMMLKGSYRRFLRSPEYRAALLSQTLQLSSKAV